jgi:hypothetical protein
MGKQIVTLFRPYDFKLGQKIHIERLSKNPKRVILGLLSS